MEDHQQFEMAADVKNYKKEKGKGPRRLKACGSCFHESAGQPPLLQNEGFYVVIPGERAVARAEDLEKGWITHVQILPKDHFTSIHELEDDQIDQLKALSAKVTQLLRSKMNCGDVVFSEVFCADSHLHAAIDVVGLSKDIEELQEIDISVFLHQHL
mmetsp:Transcript_32911/g.50319  ORF Transcript_32911/g.50319 Transcript_32911/m.50319 type:complete len:157 (+) Transcript_32911:650-1120(+)